MKMKHSLFVFVLAAITLSCKKTPAPPATKAIAYLAGAIPSGNFTTRACYWKDSALVLMDPVLPPSDQSYQATAIAQIGSTVYTCGYRTHNLTGENKVCFWANGKEFAADDQGLPTYPGIPTGMFAAGNTLYIVGELQFAGQPVKPFYWVNRTTFEVQDVVSTKGASSVSGIYVADGKLYLSGYSAAENDVAKPCYWQNNVRVMLPMPANILDASASDIIVVDGVIHVCGNGSDDLGRSVPLYWRNGVLTALDLPGDLPQGMANSIDIFEGDVYIAGANGGTGSDPVACYWKNGQFNALSKIDGGFGSAATSIKVTKNLVYVAGNADIRTVFYPCIWKNGVLSMPQLPAAPGYTGIYGKAGKMIFGR